MLAYNFSVDKDDYTMSFVTFYNEDGDILNREDLPRKLLKHLEQANLLSYLDSDGAFLHLPYREGYLLGLHLGDTGEYDYFNYAKPVK